jgi:hypothetical protein
MFEQLKNDVELVLDTVYKYPKTSYENWIYRIIHSEKYDHKKLKEIFTKWHNAFKELTEQSKLDLDIVKTMDEVIYKTSLLKLATLLTKSETNKNIIDFLCTIYGCQDKKELASEIFSNKMQNSIFEEQYASKKEGSIGYDKGLLVLDNLGIIEQMIVHPDRYIGFPFHDQLQRLTTGGWDITPVVSELVPEEDFHVVRDYLDLERMGRIDMFAVLDGQVRASVDMDSGSGFSEIMSDDDEDPCNNYILRPIYLVEGLGLVTDPNLVKLDRLKRIAGFDLCEKPSKL